MRELSRIDLILEISDRYKHLLKLEREYNWQKEKLREGKTEEEARFIENIIDKLEEMKKVVDREIEEMKNLLILLMEKKEEK